MMGDVVPGARAGKAPRLERAAIDSPIGTIVVVAHDAALVLLDFADHEARWAPTVARRFIGSTCTDAPDPAGAITALRAYLAGDLAALDRIAVDPGGTPFQHAVWTALRTIPPGTTISYAELARRVGTPSGFRAVGITNGRNPISIVLPCHRVIGKDGSLTGYGGGIARKRWLLAHEGAMPAAQPGLFEG